MFSDDMISDVSFSSATEGVTELNSRNAFLVLSNCGFLVKTHWKQLMGHLGMSLDERNRLETMAMLSLDFNHALEEGLDGWLRGGHRTTGGSTHSQPSWEQLIEGVELLEPVTADKLRHTLRMRQLPSHRNVILVSQIAQILRRHMNDLCTIIRDPSTIARQLFEHRMIPETCYFATLSIYLPHKTDNRTRALMETLYSSTIDRCRIDIVNTLILVLEEISVTRPMASLMRKEFDQALLQETVTPMTTSPLTSQPHSRTGSPSDQDFIDIILTKSSAEKFELMRYRFGSLLMKLQKSFDTKPVPLTELKDQIIFAFSDLEEFIDPCNSSSSVIRVLRKTSYCTFANCTVVKCLVKEFELTEMVPELDSYDQERRMYYETIKLEDFVQEAQESIGQNRKVIFRLDWRKDKKVLAEFEQMLRAVFDEAARFITLRCIEDGSVIMVCECPAAMTECLRIIAESKEELLSSYGVLMLTIGDNIVMKRRARVYCSFDGSGSFGGRSSNDMREVDFLPEVSSKEVPEWTDDVTTPSPPPPIPPRSTPVFTRKRSLPAGKLDHSVYQSQRSHDVVSSLPIQYTYSNPSPSRTMSESKMTRPPYPPPLPSRAVSFGPTIISRPSTKPRSPLSTSPILRGTVMSQSPEGEEPMDSMGHSTTPTSPDTSVVHPSSYVISVEPNPLKQYQWYWDGPLTLEDVTKSVLSEPADGSFIVYKSLDTSTRDYTITFRHNGNIKHVTACLVNEKYILNVGPQQIQFDSLALLVEHYSKSPLPLTDSDKYPVTLECPIIQDFTDGDDAEKSPDIKETLNKLEDVFKRLEGMNKEYQIKHDYKLKIKKDLDDLECCKNGYEVTCELFTSSLDTLEKSIGSTTKRDSVSLNKMTKSYHMIKTKIGDIEKQISTNSILLFSTRNNYHTLVKICNSLLMDLNEINKEKDALVSQLTNQGLTEEDIYAMIETVSSGDTEETYMKFYKKQLDLDESVVSDVYEYVTLRETRHRGIVRHPRHHYDYLQWEPPQGNLPKKEPHYETVRGSEQRLSSGSLSTPDIPSMVSSISTTPTPTNQKKLIAWTPSSWYCNNIDGKTAERMLSKKQVGTFLCRPVDPAKDKVTREGGATHVYTLHVVSAANRTVQLKILRQKNMFGLNVPCIFNSLYDLIMHHTHTSLEVYDPNLVGTLMYPVNK